MKWVSCFLLLLLGCQYSDKSNTSSSDSTQFIFLDSTKYDGLYCFLDFYCELPKSGVYLNRNAAFLLNICNYTRFDNYSEWHKRRYENKIDILKEPKNTIYYELIDLDAAFKPKITGKLYFWYQADIDVRCYLSDTSKSGFYFKLTDFQPSYNRKFQGIFVERLITSTFDTLCNLKSKGYNSGRCLYGEYENIIKTPYRIITDEEIASPNRKEVNEYFLKNTQPLN